MVQMSVAKPPQQYKLRVHNTRSLSALPKDYKAEFVDPYL